jgi:hypothetical protein
MRKLSFLVLAFVVGSWTLGPALAADKPMAGWYGLYPQFSNYALFFTAPKVGKGKKPKTYQQSVRYDWTGGDFRTLTITLVRDPAFKKDFAPETLRKAKPAPKEVKVGKKTGWLTVSGEGIKKVHQLVIPLADETAVLVKSGGSIGEAGIVEMAKKLDLAAIATALKLPPRTDFKRKLETFRSLKKGASMRDVEHWVGFPDADVGSGIHVLEYKLGDGSRVLIGTPDLAKVMYVKHEKDGTITDLAK